jgi:hypothetical protein
MPLLELPDKFKTEDEKIAALQKYEDDGGTDPTEVEKIGAVPVEQPDPPEEGEEVMEVETPAEEPKETPTEEPKEAPKETPKEEPKETPKEAPREPEKKGAPEARNWTVKEEDISKETYEDKREGRTRPFITHRNFPDLQKSYIKNQKHTYYVENVLMPQEIKAAEDRVRAEYEQKLKDVQVAPKETPAPTPAPSQPPAAPAAPTGDLQKSSANLKKALDELKAIDPSDPSATLEHGDKLHAALTGALDHIGNLTNYVVSGQKQVTDLTTKVTQTEQESQRTAAQTAAQREQDALRTQAEKNFEDANVLINTFAANNELFKEQYGNLDQSYKDMTQNALDFHTRIAGVLFNKSPSIVTGDETKAAVAAYLRPDQQQLRDQLKSYGIDEPNNYRAWLELDQVDAIRVGMFRDPYTKEWRQLIDPVSKKPVRLGDMDTAYGKYLDVTGKRKQLEDEKLRQERDKITGAITKRDDGIVSMDTNNLRGDGSGADITVEQATDTLEQIDEEVAISAYMMGDKSQVETINRARQRLGVPSIDTSAFDAPVVVRPKS